MRWSQGVHGRFVIHILDKIRVEEYAESKVKGDDYNGFCFFIAG